MDLSPIQTEILTSASPNTFTDVTQLNTQAGIEETYEHCKQLSLRGLLRERHDRSYRRTTAGQRLLEAETTIDNIESALHRIVDLSYFSAEDIKFRNTKFLFGDGPYRIKHYESRGDTKAKIWRVRNGDIRKLLRRFPRDCCLRRQCAFWMRAWTGKHLFQDANHRTAIALLRELLDHKGLRRKERWPVERTQQAIRESKLERPERTYPLDRLYKNDAHFWTWWFYFVDILDHE